MKLQDILDSANAVADETLDFQTGVKFINDCVSKINVECDSIYPTYTANDAQVDLVIPDKWALALFVPFVSARIKQIDASQFEFNQFFGEFFNNLKDFKMKYTIPDQYVDTDAQGGYDADFSENWNQGDWTGNNNSNDPFTP